MRSIEPPPDMPKGFLEPLLLTKEPCACMYVRVVVCIMCVHTVVCLFILPPSLPPSAAGLPWIAKNVCLFIVCDEDPLRAAVAAPLVFGLAASARRHVHRTVTSWACFFVPETTVGANGTRACKQLRNMSPTLPRRRRRLLLEGRRLGPESHKH